MSCTSCGAACSGSSCSMCYGDPGHGDDGYYEEFLKQQWEEEMQRKGMEQEEEMEIAHQCYLEEKEKNESTT